MLQCQKWTAAAVVLVSAMPVFAQDCAQGQRVFEHYLGSDCIPENPQRIITLSARWVLLPLLELGVIPVASTGSFDSDGIPYFPGTEQYDTSGVQHLGSVFEIDAEAIAAMEPDVILVQAWNENLRDRFQSIAPVLGIDTHYGPMAEGLMQYAELTEREERAAELRNEFEAMAEQINTELAEEFANTTVSVIGYFNYELYATSSGWPFYMVYEFLDLKRPEYEESVVRERDGDIKSWETIDDHAADVQFITVFDENDGQSNEADEYRAIPAVAATPVAQANQIFHLDGIEIMGGSWTHAMRAMEAIASVIGREDLQRDLVVE